MNNLTNKQKISLCRKMICKLESVNTLGFWEMGFCAAFSVNEVYANSGDMLKILPELKKYKPHRTIISYYNGYWFDKSDSKLRIIILKEVIKDLKKKVKL